MGILDSFTDTTNSDNRCQFLCDDDTDEIVIGGSCTHTFEFPFTYSTYAKSGKIIYKQGFDTILEITITSSMVTEVTGKSLSIITVSLTPAQTQLFSKTVMDTSCQVRLITTSDNVVYDEPHKIKVVSPLVVEEVVVEDSE